MNKCSTRNLTRQWLSYPYKLCSLNMEGLYCDKYCSVSPVGCHDSASPSSKDHICCHWRRGLGISGSLWHPSTMGICRWSCYLPCCGYAPIVPLVELRQERCWDAHIRNHNEDMIMSKYYLPSLIISCLHPAFVKINISRVMLGNLVCELSSIIFTMMSIALVQMAIWLNWPFLFFNLKGSSLILSEDC